MITPGQIRDARALLRIEQRDLAHRAQLSVATVRRLEAASAGSGVVSTTVEQIQKVLEEAGAELITDGVRRRRSDARDTDVIYRRLWAIAERSAAMLADNPPLSDDELYDEHGLPA